MFELLPSDGNGARLAVHAVIPFDNNGKGCFTFPILKVKNSG